MYAALDMIYELIPVLALMFFAVVTSVGIRRYRRRKRPPPADRCKCGYLLDNLSLARCPECGRVFHFDATAEELGLTPEQLQKAQEARILRRAKDQ